MFPVYSSNGFGNGLGSLAPGLNSDVFGSLQRSLTDYMNEQQIQPFIQEVRSMAKERFGFGENQGSNFDLSGSTVSNFGPGVGDATLKVPDQMLPPLTDYTGAPPVAAGTAPQPMISNPAPMGPSERDPDRFRDAFNAFRNTLRPEGDMGRYVAPGETITYDQFVELGRPADLAAAEAAGYGGGALLVDNLGNNVSLSGLSGSLTNGGLGFPQPLNQPSLGGGLIERDPNPMFLGRPDFNAMAEITGNITDQNPMGVGPGAGEMRTQPVSASIGPPVGIPSNTGPEIDLTQLPTDQLIDALRNPNSISNANTIASAPGSGFDERMAFDNNSLLPGGPAQLPGIVMPMDADEEKLIRLRGSLPPAMAEADIQPAYERARAAAAKRRAEGFLGQVVLPGEMPFEDFRRLNLMPGRGLGISNETEFAGQLLQPNFAEGGPVMMNRDPMATGLGSFLASNIDEFGRNGDTEVIHATKSEVVLPKGMVDNPEVRRTVRDLFEQTGRDMQEYTVGSGEMNVNPMTGYEEAFDLIGGIKDIFKKAAPVLLPIATTFMFPGMSPFLSGALAGGVGSLIQGGSIEDAFKEGIKGGLVSSATNALFNPGQRNPFKPVDSSYENAFDLRKDPLGDLGLGGKAAASNAKGYFMDPKLDVNQVAQQAGFESFAAAPETSRAVLTQAAVNSGGMNLGRTIAGGLGALALAGGFDEIPADDVEDPYPYSSRELMEMYPERYRTGPVIAPTRLPLEDKIQTQFAAKGGEMEFPRRQGYIAGPGTETSDDIPAMLSDGEFVMTARAVRGAGDGSRKDGVKKMYDIMRAFEGGVVS